MMYVIQNGYGKFISEHGGKKQAEKEAKRLANDHKVEGESQNVGSPPFMVYECRMVHCEV